MNRREFIKCIAGGALAAALPNCDCSTANPGGIANQPNIILIMADDLGYGDIGCYGSKKISTPNIDALAKGGMKFTDYHSNCPVCSPTRAALLTGRYQQRAGIEGVIYAKGPTRQTGLALEETTFAEVLKTRGYVTGIFGKWHLGYNVEFNPVRQGFDEFRGYVSGKVDYHSHIRRRLRRLVEKARKGPRRRLLHRLKFELYDLQNDTHEIKNLADDPKHEKVLAELKA